MRSDHKEAAALLRRMLPPRGQLAGYGRPVGAMLLSIAVAYQEEGEAGNAIEFYEKALEINRRVLPEDAPNLTANIGNLATAYLGQGEYGKALRLSEEALTIRRRLLVGDHEDIAGSLHNVARAHYYRGEFSRAVERHREALEMQRRLLPGDDEKIVMSLHCLAECHQGPGRAQAGDGATRGGAGDAATVGAGGPPDIARSLARIGEALGAVGDYAAGLLRRKEALPILTKSLPPGSRAVQKVVKAIETFGAKLPGTALQAAEPTAVDWSSKSVYELRAFLQSQGVDLGEGADKDDMVQVAMALAAEEGQGA
jgi:tetratricopeptide (TPR) repeat protein